MICKQCNNELRIVPEEVGVDAKGMPIYHRFGYCDTCMQKIDLDETTNSNVINSVSSTTTPNPTSTKKKQSTLSVLAAIFAFFTCTCFIGLILGIIDIAMNDKSKKHTGSWFAVIFTGIIIMIGGIGLFSSSSDDSDDENTKNPTKVVTSLKPEENTAQDNNEISSGGSFTANDLKVTINEIDTNYTEYDNQYGLHDLDEGYKFIKLSFTYENNGKDDSYVSIYDYDCYADGALCEQYYSFGGDFINANLSSGRNVSFDTYYVVPDNSKNIELEYTTNVWTDEKIIIKVQ